MNIDESIRELKGYLTWLEANGFSKLAKDSAIETLLTAYEKEKGKNVKLRLQDIPLIQGELKAYKDRVNELKQELEKEKEKNKGAEEKIKKYINKIQKELDKYKIKNTNTYIQIEGNPEINGLLIQKATLEELIKEE